MISNSTGRPSPRNLARPVLRFIDGGWLVAASAEACHVYRTAENYKIRWEASLAHGHGEPIAVLAAARPGQFALFGASGTIAIYQMPG